MLMLRSGPSRGQAPSAPMLPKQTLLINFLTDLPEMTIARDNGDPNFVQAPHRGDIGLISRFMIVFGILSLAFDYLTFAVLLWVLHAGPELFRTGWFVESMLSATLVVFSLHTWLPFTRSRPSRALLIVTSVVWLVTLAIPCLPVAGPLGFKALPPLYLLSIVVIVVAYFASAELTKQWFYCEHVRGVQR